jgi:hypothetical protein
MYVGVVRRCCWRKARRQGWEGRQAVPGRACARGAPRVALDAVLQAAEAGVFALETGGISRVAAAVSGARDFGDRRRGESRAGMRRAGDGLSLWRQA